MKKKKQKLDDTISDASSSEVESGKPFTGQEDRLLAQFRSLLECADPVEDLIVSGEKLRKVTAVLDPAMINTYFQAASFYQSHPHFGQTIGPFTSRLIQNSYRAGHNQFLIRTEAMTLSHISSIGGSRLQGKKNDHLNVTIIGKGFSLLCDSSTYVDCLVKGSVDYECGGASKHCQFTIEGGWGCGLAREARYSTFYLKSTDDKNSHLPYACGCGRDSLQCTFMTDDEAVLRCLKNFPRGNRIAFVNPEGGLEVIRDYNESSNRRLEKSRD